MKENKIAGVYKITNTITGDFYIGSSNDVKRRWSNHKSPSKWKLRSGMKLYQAFIKFGLDNFTFEIIEETDNLKKREQYWIEQLNPSYNNYRANGIDIEKRKEAMKRCKTRWYKAHREERLIKGIEYNKTHQKEIQVYQKEYYGRLCFYNNETLTLGALSRKFQKLSIPHATLEAKKYLITEEDGEWNADKTVIVKDE